MEGNASFHYQVIIVLTLFDKLDENELALETAAGTQREHNQNLHFQIDLLRTMF